MFISVNSKEAKAKNLTHERIKSGAICCLVYFPRKHKHHNRKSLFEKEN
jgi:hypothetical protein